jgi:hypothetical protein
VGVAVGSGDGVSLGATDALGSTEALGSADSVGIGLAFAESTNVPVPPSSVVNVSSSSSIDHVVTVPSAWAKRLPYDSSGQATSVLGPGMMVIWSLRPSSYVPATELQSARAANVPLSANWIV